MISENKQIEQETNHQTNHQTSPKEQIIKLTKDRNKAKALIIAQNKKLTMIHSLATHFSFKLDEAKKLYSDLDQQIWEIKLKSERKAPTKDPIKKTKNSLEKKLDAILAKLPKEELIKYYAKQEKKFNLTKEKNA